jgi:hypothetical protein
MLTTVKSWISAKLLYVKIGLAILVVASFGFLYIQNTMYRKDIEKAKVELEQKEMIIKNQSIAISAQRQTIELANSMGEARDAELKKFAANVDSKIKPINDIIVQIKNGKFEKPQCEPSQSVKAVVDSIQNGVK